MNSYEKMNVISKKCEELERETENDQEIIFLKTASAFFNELALHEELYPEARISFVKKVVHDLECAL